MTADERYRGRGRPRVPLHNRIEANSMRRDQGYETLCRVWRSPRPRGYVNVTVWEGDRKVQKPLQIAAWEDANGGAVPRGLQVDHLCCDPLWCEGGDTCPHRACSEPSHLQLATPRENTLRSNSPSAVNARKTHCPYGHPYYGENLYVRSDGSRACKECSRRRVRERRARTRVDAHRAAV